MSRYQETRARGGAAARISRATGFVVSVSLCLHVPSEVSTKRVTARGHRGVSLPYRGRPMYRVFNADNWMQRNTRCGGGVSGVRGAARELSQGERLRRACRGDGRAPGCGAATLVLSTPAHRGGWDHSVWAPDRGVRKIFEKFLNGRQMKNCSTESL